MLSPNKKKNINYLEIELKEKSPTIKGQNETGIYNRKKNERLKIKRNKASSISSNYKEGQINNLKNKKEYNKINEGISNIQKQTKEKNDSIQKIDINYIKTNYNLEEAYRKNHLIEDTFKNNIPQTCKGNINFKTYDFFNNKNRKNNSVTFANYNNIYYNNSINNNDIYISNNINNYLIKNNDEQTIEDDYKNYTASYRGKMVNKLKGKLCRDNLVDDYSLSELKSEKPSLSLLDNKNECKTKSNKENEFSKIKIENNNNKYKIIINQSMVKKLHRYKISKNSVQILDNNYIKGNYRIHKAHEENELRQSKNKGIRNYIGLIKKDEIKNKTSNNCLLIQDLLNNINKRNELSFTKSKIHKNNINNNITINSNPLNSSRKQSNNNKSKNKCKTREKKLNDNKTFIRQYFKKHLIKGSIHKSMDIHPLNREKKLYTQRILSNLRKKKYIKKNNFNYNLTDLAHKNISLNNLISKNKKNIKSSSVNKNRERKKNSFYYRKIQIKSEENKKMLNRTMIKDRKLLASLIIKKYKRKKDLLNKTSNNLNYDYNTVKGWKKINLQLTPVFSSSLIEEKINSKGKTPLGKRSRYFSDIDLTSILNNYNKNTYNKKKYECLNINDFYNYNNISKNNKISNGRLITSIKKKLKNKNIHKIK
jgi:hypothetical protein